MSKVPKNKNVSWVSTASVAVGGLGVLRVDYKSSVRVLFHLCQLYLLWNLLSLAVPF